MCLPHVADTPSVFASEGRVLLARGVSPRKQIPHSKASPTGPLGRQHGSVPKVWLIVFNVTPLQERDELFFEGGGSMMLGLIRNVLLYVWNVGLAHRKRAVSGLPGEFTLSANVS